jgi:SAM-dependent methyltransferase
MTTTVYDEVRYSNHPYGQTHPDRLATVAVLHGLAAPDPYRARVLEIGCGAGGNLIAMAAATPGIEAVGVDLAQSAVDEGRAVIAAVGLANAALHQGDVRALTNGELGPFDFVVAHGVYSWVPDDARDALLAAVHSHLAPGGLAYVSFNAHPGGYFRRILRDAGLWHARGITDQAERAMKAQELYRFLRDQRMTGADMYGTLLERILPALADGPVWRLVHDDLSDHWKPFWFADFAAHAARHGLDFVGEADLSGLRAELLPDDVEPEVWRFAGGDRVAFEQYSDLMIPRFFRQPVLCHTGAEIAVAPRPEHAARLHWAARPDARPLEVGLVADAFAVLDEARPRTVAFATLRELLGADPLALGEALLDGFRRERLMPHAGELRAAREPGERPEISPLARWQAAQGPDMTSLAYQTVRMEEPAARALITLLDGTRDREQILAGLRERTGLELTLEDLDANLSELARLFLVMP